MRTVRAKSGWVKSMPPGQSRQEFFGEPRRRDAVEHLARGDEGAVPGGILDVPGASAVAAAGQQVFLGFGAVDVVAVGAEVLVGAGAEADEDFVAPGPKAVVSGPAGEPPRFVVDHHVLGSGRRLGRPEGEAH
jgi:hypothetical protein